jgi:hypothetical protein
VRLGQHTPRLVLADGREVRVDALGHAWRSTGGGVPRHVLAALRCPGLPAPVDRR